ncbi:hydroxyacylglutathione hydrolase [Tamilnaduibacter salinus]|uniref:Hydroxyacylglutathione hydrolase n=1 Tax=Tamilnaduibacter salinus TaxID=1484056 RepID=A0A2U1CZL6_9GAMM|nr:hydroxyacylglutathione hydrolase [Tamilnaduibacter salinus]PVY78217.1 hydroxyacylglutathione hydrolase [Tamilnaduibacter salinus]
MLTIHPVPAFSDNYIWCLANHDRKTALIVDPGQAAPVEAFLESNGLTPTAILVTHHHPDHVGGVNQLAERYGVDTIYGPDGSPFDGILQPVGDDDNVTWESLSFRVIRVPGHTLDHIAFFCDQAAVDNAPVLFCGDTLFACGCGRLFEGKPAQMHQSLSRLRALPDATRVYAAHEYTLANLRFSRHLLPEDDDLAAFETQCKRLRESDQPTLPTPLSQEKALNPFLRWDDPAVIAAVSGDGLQADEVFARVRQAKDRF